MGARGKKRKRKDGSIASGKVVPPSWRGGPYKHEQFPAVDMGDLLAAITIIDQHASLDNDGPWGDWDIEDIHDAIDEYANTRKINADALGTRAEKLNDFLIIPENKSLYSRDNDGRVSVNLDLLKFAATSPIDDSNKPLHWQPIP